MRIPDGLKLPYRIVGGSLVLAQIVFLIAQTPMLLCPGIGIVVLLLGALGAAALDTSPHTWAASPDSDLTCMQCGYDLTGLPENRCPECGTSFDPHDLTERWAVIRHSARVAHHFVLLLAAYPLCGCLAVAVRHVYITLASSAGQSEYWYTNGNDSTYSLCVVGGSTMLALVIAALLLRDLRRDPDHKLDPSYITLCYGILLLIYISLVVGLSNYVATFD